MAKKKAKKKTIPAMMDKHHMKEMKEHIKSGKKVMGFGGRYA